MFSLVASVLKGICESINQLRAKRAVKSAC